MGPTHPTLQDHDMLTPLLLAAVLQVPAPTQELAPGTRYDPSIPTLQQVAAHDPREEITPPDEVIAYMEALAEAAPQRTRLLRYGFTWEGRPLVMLLIGSAARMGSLEEVIAGLHRLYDPRGLSDADAERLIAGLPVVTALVHGIHGNEISSSGAAMAEAYHLLAAVGDADVDRVLAESLVLIDPMQNPDGRARFVMTNTGAESRWPDPAPWSAEHDEPWPGGRGNHYLFDLNRDGFIQSQPETVGKLSVFLEYTPHVVVDLHEMGGNSSYFFPPTAPPANPWLTERQIQLMDVFGSANARAFDRRGFMYFNRDTYDAFYPGYMDMWPMLHGALAMTYEQASARALVLRRDDGDLLTYGDGVLHHVTAAIQTAQTAAANRERILRDYLAFRREAVSLARQGPAEYVLTSSHDPGMAERLARNLVMNGIEVHAASGPVTVGGRTIPVSAAFIVPAAQPNYRMVRNLLDADTPMDTAFVRRQNERRALRRPDEIYDVTAWSLSALWDVEVIPSQRSTGATGELLTREEPAATPAPLPPAVVGYLLPWGTNAAAATAEALREGIRMQAAGGAFTLGGRSYGIGTAIVRTADNGPELRTRLADIAARHGAEVVPIDDSYVREGVSLGDDRTRVLSEPRVLLLYDEPASSTSVGFARYVLERRYGQRTSIVRGSSFGQVILSEYDVIILPSGNYSSVIGESGVERLRDWMSDGGTLVTMAGSSQWAAREDVGLLHTTAERRGGRPEREDPPEDRTPEQPIDFLEAIAPEDEAPEDTPGAILRVVLDSEHWLSSGTDGEIGAVVQGTRIFSPIRLDEGTNVGRYGEEDDLLLGGIVWDQAEPQLASKAFLIHQPEGRGQLIAFAEEPNYRAYAEATELLFINAVLLGPGK
jgi:hypothetical protein